MWSLRVLSGSASGQVFQLKAGKVTIGRSSHCDIILNSVGISKEHAVLEIQNDRISVKDLSSSNGTFVNGKRVQQESIQLGDKLSFHDVYCDISYEVAQTEKPKKKAAPRRAPAPAAISRGQAYPPVQAGAYSGGNPQGYPQAVGMGYPQMGYPQMPMPQGLAQPQPAVSEPARPLFEKIFNSLENNLMPPFYRLTETLDFKLVLASFIAVFIFVTTLFSVLPMIQLNRSSIVNESLNRALSLAKSMAEANKEALSRGQYSGVNLMVAETDPGVKSALIVQVSDGMILAPSSRSGQIASEPFVHTARRVGRDYSATIDLTTVGGSAPIFGFDPATGENSVKGYSVIIYDAKQLSFDDGLAVSFFMITLIVACGVGLVVFTLMFRLIEYPIKALNAELDTAIRERQDIIEIPFQYPAIQALLGNVNSLLSRYASSESSSSQSGHSNNKDYEALNLVNLITLPALAIANDQRVIVANERFSKITSIEFSDLVNTKVSDIPDSSLSQNLLDLILRAQQDPAATQNDQLEFAGRSCLLSCQNIGGSSEGYYVITVSPMDGGSE